MLKKIVIAFIALFAVILVTSCSSPATPQSWDGTWKAEGFKAVIQDQTIEINLVTPDAESLYWKGTFTGGNVKNGDFKSTADQDALAKSIFGSQDAEKTFVSKDGKLGFTVQMMGVKRNVELTR